MSVFNRLFMFIQRQKNAVLAFIVRKPTEPTVVNVLQPILNSKGNYIFYCLGCEANHLISTTPKGGTYHTLTGTLAKPTVRASILVSGNRKLGVPHCHAYITEGMIEYLDDCSHNLAGKTVPMEPL
jgi:hypothetical protein